MYMYDMPSTKEAVKFLLAALGLPTKATMLTAACHDNLVTLQGVTTNAISKHFPELDETQKEHIYSHDRAFKGHFISVLAGISDDFPIREWDDVAPNISVYAYHHRSFNTMGCAVQFHIKPNRRRTWSEHSMEGWYIKTSP